MNTQKILAAVALSVFGFQAFGQAYDVEVARVQVDLKCEISEANGGATDCQIDVKARGKQMVKLEPNQDSQAGFTGVDTVNLNGSQYFLVLSASDAKVLGAVTLMRMQQGADGQSFDATLAGNVTNSLTAYHINPMSIQVTAPDTVKVALTVLAYAPAEANNAVAAMDKNGIANEVLKQIQPAIKAAKAAQK